LKRLEFRLAQDYQLPTIEICIVDSKAQTLYKMRLGPRENQYFSVGGKPITKEEPACFGFGNGGAVMRALHRRLLGLDRFGPPVETEYSRELQGRIEVGRRLPLVAFSQNRA
jgi:hypothetical protein